MLLFSVVGLNRRALDVVLVALAVLLGVMGPARAQNADITAEALTIIGEAQAAGKAAPTVRVFQRGNCGSAANRYLCFTLEQPAASPSMSTYRSTPALNFRAPGPGKVIVTWHRTAYCQSGSVQEPATSDYRWEIYLNLQIQTSPGGIPYNAPGSAGIGYREMSPNLSSQYFANPVSLTRTFAIPAAGPQTFFLRTRAEFRDALFDILGNRGFCNLNGGAMTALFVGQ